MKDEAVFDTFREVVKVLDDDEYPFDIMVPTKNPWNGV